MRPRSRRRMSPSPDAPARAEASGATRERKPIGGAHLGEREEKRERRLRALVLVQAIDVDPVAATAGRRVVDRASQRVLAEEPVECAPRVVEPARVARSRAARRGTPRPSRTPRPAADRSSRAARRARGSRSSPTGAKVPSAATCWRHEPLERAHADLGHLVVAHPRRRHEQRLREARVAVREPVLEPGPVGAAATGGSGRSAWPRAPPASPRRCCRPRTRGGTRRCRAARRPTRAGS